MNLAHFLMCQFRLAMPHEYALNDNLQVVAFNFLNSCPFLQPLCVCVCVPLYQSLTNVIPFETKSFHIFMNCDHEGASF